MSAPASSILPPVACPSLTDLCLAHFSAHLDELGYALQALPEELVQQLLCRVLAEGRLTPRLVSIFQRSDHDSITRWLKQNIRIDAAFIHDATHSCRPGR